MLTATGPGSLRGLIINAAITGMVPMPDRVPHVPIRPEADEARHEAGASKPAGALTAGATLRE